MLKVVSSEYEVGIMILYTLEMVDFIFVVDFIFLDDTYLMYNLVK